MGDELTFHGLNKTCKRVVGSNGTHLEAQFTSNLGSRWADHHDNRRSFSSEGCDPTGGGRPAGEHQCVDVSEQRWVRNPDLRRVCSHHRDVVARRTEQISQRSWCTISLGQQDADVRSAQSNVQRLGQFDSDLAVGNHINRSTSSVGKHAGRGGTDCRQRHARMLFRCVADTFGAGSRRNDQPVVVGKVTERRSECRSPVVRVGRFDERDMNDVGATFGKQPPELPGTVTSDHNTSTGQRTQSVSIARHGQFSASCAE
jgi:hypothetical protein